jgi:hypothetical protein
MASALRDKLLLWKSSKRGLKSRFTDDVKKSVDDRSDVAQSRVKEKKKRGDAAQKLRLRYYPSIDVDRDKLFAGRIDGELDDARNRLLEMGFRNNPTAYVEVTEEYGPDDGSYSLQYVTEDATRFDIPRLVQQPTLFKRIKRQIHVTIYGVGDRVEFLTHEEMSAWLQPARHVVKGDATAEIGVRNFRDEWFDEFGEELPGKPEVQWPTAH